MLLKFTVLPLNIGEISNFSCKCIWSQHVAAGLTLNEKSFKDVMESSVLQREFFSFDLVLLLKSVFILQVYLI